MGAQIRCFQASVAKHTRWHMNSMRLASHISQKRRMICSTKEEQIRAVLAKQHAVGLDKGTIVVKTSVAA